MTYRLVPCDINGCGRMHGVKSVSRRPSREGSTGSARPAEPSLKRRDYIPSSGQPPCPTA